jgi:hypothetical protein
MLSPNQIITRIRQILDDNENFQTDDLKLGAIWFYTQRAGLKFITYRSENENVVEVLANPEK